ncbi:hypothetical protein Tco_0303171, partial [Tanacetum coccineum]
MTKSASEQEFLNAVYEEKTHDTLNTSLYACFLSQIEPTSIAKALSDSSWVEAMQEELLQFKLQQVWKLVDLPNGKRAIRTKWVFRNKKDERGIIIRNKERSMIGSLMYLIASRPDIMLQYVHVPDPSSPKTSHPIALLILNSDLNWSNIKDRSPTTGRNFDLEDMELESTNSGPTAKLPILKLGEYEMCAIRIKQYFQIQDYALWKVIKNYDSWVSISQTIEENGITTSKMSTPSTAEEKTKKKNDVKARDLLLMALPNEHQLTFSQYPDAKSMFADIKTRFGGNAATKKTQKTLLKQQYENFSATSAESLDSIFNRLQKIASRLAILGVIIAQEDLN